MEDTTKNLNGVTWLKRSIATIILTNVIGLIVAILTNNLVINPLLSKLNWKLLYDLNKEIPLTFITFIVIVSIFNRRSIVQFNSKLMNENRDLVTEYKEQVATMKAMESRLNKNMIEFLQLKNDDLVKENLELRWKIRRIEYEYRIKI